MIYVFDTSSFSVSRNFFPARFPSFWRDLGDLVSQGKVVSVREVFNELERWGIKSHLREWAKANKAIFMPPTPEETLFVSKIFSVPHFQYLVAEKQRLTGAPLADPFVIASAKVRKGCVVTEEEKRPNAAKIPNVCEYFGIDCTNLEDFMGRQGWSF
ncbi:DUF4411 family protein [bacterium]|nr:DUF4411 family protein [bacterium]